MTALVRTAGAALPDFAIIGAMKAGTTTLHRLLDGHPDISMSRMKETDYFIESAQFGLGPKWYSAQFDLDTVVVGEASPNYTKRDLFPGVPERMAAQAPEARLIFVARDPVARFASHYRHAWLLGHMTEHPDTLLDSDAGRHMLATSRYAWQLQPWIECFGRDSLMIVDFDALRAAPQGVFDSVCDHIGVDRHPAPQICPQNEGTSLARMPKSLQRLWRSRAMRRLDPLISRGLRDRLRRALSRGSAREAPNLAAEVLDAAAAALAEDVAAFRTLSGLPFSKWRV